MKTQRHGFGWVLLAAVAAAPVWSQGTAPATPPAPAASAPGEPPTIVLREDQLRQNVGRQVKVLGTTGNFIPDPVEGMQVIRLTDQWDSSVRLRFKQGLGYETNKRYTVKGTVTQRPDGTFEIIDQGGVVEGWPTDAPPPPPPKGNGENGGKGGGGGGDGGNDHHWLLYAGIGLVVAALILLLVMWRQSMAAQEREQLIAIENERQAMAQRQAELEQRMVQMQQAPMRSPTEVAPKGRGQTMMSLGKLDVTGGPHAGATFPLSSFVTVIGRSEGDVKLSDDETISGRHARVVYNNDGSVSFIDESRNGSRVNGKAVHQAQVTLNNGDTVEIGLCTLKFTNFRAVGAAPGVAPVAPDAGGRRSETVMAPVAGAPGAAAKPGGQPAVPTASRAATAMFLGAELKVTRGPDDGKSFALQKAVTTIGRMDDQDVQLGDATVSRRHALVRHEGGNFVLSNVSDRGTLLNGKPLTADTEIKDGDQIELGGTVLTLRKI